MDNKIYVNITELYSVINKTDNDSCRNLMALEIDITVKKDGLRKKNHECFLSSMEPSQGKESNGATWKQAWRTERKSECDTGRAEGVKEEDRLERNRAACIREHHNKTLSVSFKI